MSDSQGKGGCLQAAEGIARLLESVVKIGGIVFLLLVGPGLLPKGEEAPLPVGVVDVCADLERSKTSAEGLCRIARWSVIREGGQADLFKGQLRYLRARADLDEFVGWLTARMLVGFQDGDETTLNSKWKRARESRKEFFDWCFPSPPPKSPPAPGPAGEEGRPTYGDAVGDAVNAVVEISGRKADRRERIIAELVERLDACRWRPWEELGPPPKVEEPPVRSESMRPALPAPRPTTPVRRPPPIEPPVRDGDDPWLPEEPENLEPCPPSP